MLRLKAKYLCLVNIIWVMEKDELIKLNEDKMTLIKIQKM